MSMTKDRFVSRWMQKTMNKDENLNIEDMSTRELALRKVS